MKRMILVSLALSVCSPVVSQQPLQGRYFTPASLAAQMNRPNDQAAQIYLMGTYDRTQDVGQSCALRGTTTPSVLAKVFSDYLMTHPELASADRTAADIAAQAFSQQWPCHTVPAIPADLDTQFVCPEVLPDDQARNDALGAFIRAVGKEAPAATVLDELHFRHFLLEKHGCQETLHHMRDAAAAISSGDPSVQFWLPVPVDGVSGVALAISGVDLEPVVDPRYPTEPAVDAHVMLTYSAPRETDVAHIRYDTVIAHNIYYCATHRFALVENDYFLSGRRTLKEPSPQTKNGATDVYEVSPVTPGSPNEAALQPACRGIGVDSAPTTQSPPGRYFTAEGLTAQMNHGKDQLAQFYLMGAYDLTEDFAQSCAQRAPTPPALLEKVYVDYISAHPDLSHADRPAAAIAAQAFAEYWPCRK